MSLNVSRPNIPQYDATEPVNIYSYSRLKMTFFDCPVFAYIIQNGKKYIRYRVSYPTSDTTSYTNENVLCSALSAHSSPITFDAPSEFQNNGLELKVVFGKKAYGAKELLEYVRAETINEINSSNDNPLLDFFSSLRKNFSDTSTEDKGQIPAWYTLLRQYGNDLHYIISGLLSLQDFGPINHHHTRLEYVQDAILELIRIKKLESPSFHTEEYRQTLHSISKCADKIDRLVQKNNVLPSVLKNTAVYGSFRKLTDFIKQTYEDGEIDEEDLQLIKVPSRFYNSILRFPENLREHYAIILWHYALKAGQPDFSYESFYQALNIFNFYTEELYFYDHIDKKGQFIDYNGNVMLDPDGVSRSRITRRVPKAEALLADLYVKSVISGTSGTYTDFVLSWVDHMIRRNQDGKNDDSLYVLASGLCWLKLYDLEKQVLQKIIPAYKGNAFVLKERLALMEKGMTEQRTAPASTRFDFISLSEDWTMDELNNFFRSKRISGGLNHSLLMKSFSKVIPLKKSQHLDKKELNRRLQLLEEDFDGTAILNWCNVKALDNPTLSYDDVPLFRFTDNQNKGVSILFLLNKFGKTLTLKQLALFTPEPSMSLEDMIDYAKAVRVNTNLNSFWEMMLQVVEESFQEESEIYENSFGTSLGNPYE